jgi:DinB superfamily
MEFKAFLIGHLKQNLGFVQDTLADFTDADMFVRPCPAANNTAWQLGHLALAESSVLKDISPAHAVPLPGGFVEAYKMEMNKVDDPAKFAPVNTKAQILDTYARVRNGTIAWVESMSAEQLDAPAPQKYAQWAPTIGLLAVGQVGHTMMHLGQFQVIRRKIGKPVLF